MLTELEAEKIRKAKYGGSTEEITKVREK